MQHLVQFCCHYCVCGFITGSTSSLREMLRAQVLDYICGFDYVCEFLSEIFCSVWFVFADAEKELALSPFFGKFNSIKMVGNKGSVTVIEYKLIEKGTSNFRESNILGEGGFGCVYRARLDDSLIVAVKKLDCATEDAEKEFEVLVV